MPLRLSDQSAAARRLRAQQRGLTRFLIRDVRGVMPRLDPRRPSSAGRWISDVRTIVDRYSRMSAEVSARAYDAERAAAEVRGRFVPTLADPPPVSQVESSLRWAAREVWSPPVEGLSREERQAEAERLADRLLANAGRNAEAVAQKLVLDTGRRTVVESVRRDPGARGWYRSADPAACAFCKLMVSRGAVYKDREAAGGRASRRFAGGNEFAWHDNCHCQAMPVMAGSLFVPSAEAERWDEIYRTYASGHSGDEMRRYRIAIRLIELGRTPTAEDFA